MCGDRASNGMDYRNEAPAIARPGYIRLDAAGGQPFANIALMLRA
jgi:hypothetical protein